MLLKLFQWMIVDDCILSDFLWLYSFHVKFFELETFFEKKVKPKMLLNFLRHKCYAENNSSHTTHR